MANKLRTPERIELQEYGTPVVRRAVDLDLHALGEANKRWKKALGLSNEPIRVEEIGNGLIKLRAEAVTGVIRIGNTDIEIAPKFLNADGGNWQTILWRILTVVEGGHLDDTLTSAHNLASLSLPDLLAEIFLSSYTKGTSCGLPRSYKEEQASGQTLRGRLDTSRLGEWVSQPWIVPYISDLLTDDTTLARLLRWAAECLTATVKSPQRARAMQKIAAELSHVGRRPPHLLDAQRITIGTQYRGLKAAKMVGVLLLEGAGVNHASGDHALSGFLWNSDVIYENYVYWLCRRAASKRGYRINKGLIKFGEVIIGDGRKLETTPDVVFRDSQGLPVAVTDSKYKRLGSRPKSPDTYQVLTAGHVLGCPRVSLTYPVAAHREPTVWLVPSALGGSPIELTALPLNLMGLVSPEGPAILTEAIIAWLDGALTTHTVESASAQSS